MRICVKFKEKNRVKIEYLKFTNFNKEIIIVESDTQEICDGATLMKGITFNEEYANGKSDMLRYVKLTDVCVIINDNEQNWVEIEAIEIIDDTPNYNTTFDIVPQCFSKFKKRLINIDGYKQEFTEEEYQKIAKYVRQQDKKDDALNALNNYNDDIPDNVCKYLSTIVIDEFAESFSAVSNYTGEDEIYQIDRFIKECGGIVYPVFVSNKGTEMEIRQTVPMLKNQLEKVEEDMREYWNGGESPKDLGIEWPTYNDDDGNVLSLEYVDEIIY